MCREEREVKRTMEDFIQLEGTSSRGGLSGWESGVGGWIDGQLNGGVDRWMDEWMDKWEDAE